jgi:hypothetical protein
LPYALLIAPGVRLSKDGSFLAAWEIRGQERVPSHARLPRLRLREHGGHKGLAVFNPRKK